MNVSKIVLFASWLATGALLSTARGDEASTVNVSYHRQGAAAYVTGGIGADEIAGLSARSNDYNLKITFALEPSHAFVADVPVRVFGENGQQILAADHAGPLLFANLPSGEYRIETAHRGTALTRSATVVEGRQTKVAFYWHERLDTASDVEGPADATSSAVSSRRTVTAADHEIPLPERPSNRTAGQLGLTVERLWTAGGITYAALTLRNTTTESLVKIDVSCEFSGARVAAGDAPRQTVLSPNERPMLPGMVRSATVRVGRGASQFQPVSCDAHAL